MNLTFEECLTLECSTVAAWDGGEELTPEELQVFDVLYWICLTLVVSVGCPLHWGIVHYEWYGGDPQKRSLVNRIMSTATVVNISIALSILVTVGLLRYNIGPPSLQAAAFRMYISLVFAIFWLANAVTALRFLQVCVWKRVKEFNEDLLNRAITRVVLLVCGVQGCLCNPEYKLFAAISVFSGRDLVAAPMAACVDGIDPLHQKFSVKANVVAGILINVVAMAAINRHKTFVTPRIIQDDFEEESNPRRARHNRALATVKALPVFALVYVISAGTLYAFSKVKAGQTISQMAVWTLLGPGHCFIVPTIFLVKNRHGRDYLKRSAVNCLNDVRVLFTRRPNEPTLQCV